MNRRTLLPLVLVPLFTLWADAQVSAPVRPGDRLKQLETNCDLLEQLVEHSLKLSHAGGKLDQADECRRAVATLNTELLRTTARPNAEMPARLAELIDQMSELIRDALAPTLAEARAQIRAGSPGAERLAQIEAAARADLATAQTALPLTGPSGQTAEVRRGAEQLDQLLKTLPTPETK